MISRIYFFSLNGFWSQSITPKLLWVLFEIVQWMFQYLKKNLEIYQRISKLFGEELLLGFD